ncbi:uncharacterized protein LOC131854187 [Achroia grisella]|uniref:uncharacterized protein LOC131854187 n=1 Tax=Achroia grisella TaxID=688607 RepID=UPI0027D30335|nr:uncharacterized protein LOC131854187 [Achroia grisella]
MILLCENLTNSTIIQQMAIASVAIWLLKNFLIFSYMCVTFERFYSAISDVHANCIIMKSKKVTAETKKMCKDVQVFTTSMFSRLSACGVFDVGSKLPFKLLFSLTSYTIIILQFFQRNVNNIFQATVNIPVT